MHGTFSKNPDRITWLGISLIVTFIIVKLFICPSLRCDIAVVLYYLFNIFLIGLHCPN
jgi:hypothetical protein